MSLYQCEKCGCVENTAVGFYHNRNSKEWWPEEFVGKKLCSACGPTEYRDGEPTEFGEWHNQFRRRFYPIGSLYTDHEGNVRDLKTERYPTKEMEINNIKITTEPS